MGKTYHTADNCEEGLFLCQPRLCGIGDIGVPTARVTNATVRL